MLTMNNLKPEKKVGTLCSAKSICVKLGLTEELGEAAYNLYRKLKTRHSLDGDQTAWLAVAIFDTNIKARPNIPIANISRLKYAPIHLPKMMTFCDLNFLEFIRNCRTWCSFSNCSDRFKNVVDNLEHKLAVSSIIFKMYRDVFADLFCDPYLIHLKESTENVDAKYPIPPSRLFEFTWILYAAVRSQFSCYEEDLVSSFNLLVVCMDFIYSNCLHTGLRDLLNPSFVALPPNFLDPDYISQPCGVSVIDAVCQRHSGTPTEAKTIKEYTWKSTILSFFRQQLLLGDVNKFNGILDSQVFDTNFKNMDDFYNSFVNSKAEFDERQFLIDCAQKTINYCCAAARGNDVQLSFINNTLVLANDEWNLFPRISTRTERCVMIQLSTIIGHCRAYPSRHLSSLIKISGINLDNLRKRLDAIVDSVLKHFKTPIIIDSEHGPPVAKRLFLAKTLYFKLLEDVLFAETKITKHALSTILEQDLIHKLLFACCFEIIIFCHTLKPAFLWIFDVMDVHAFHFYKVIELVIRTEKALPSEVVRHLATIEEYVLDHLSWNSTSPLWAILHDGKFVVPSCADVCVPLKKMQEKALAAPNQQSSNSAPASPDVERRRFLTVISKRGAVYEKENGLVSDFSGKNECDRSSAIFFRKFYNLGHVRLVNICSRLNIEDSNIVQTIWTCFEYLIMNHVDLMRNRHMDQLLICSIYVICKVMGCPLRFQEIMKAYRTQPLTSSDTYRFVTLNEIKCEDGNKPEEIVKGDIIQFYNSIFVDMVRDFVSKIDQKKSQVEQRMILSPFPIKVPKPRTILYRVSDKCNIYLGNLNKKRKLEAPSTAMNYQPFKSPQSELTRINDAIAGMEFPKRKTKIDEPVNNSDGDNSSAVVVVPVKRRRISKVIKVNNDDNDDNKTVISKARKTTKIDKTILVPIEEAEESVTGGDFYTTTPVECKE